MKVKQYFKGMQRGNEPSQQPENTYRHCEGMRMISKSDKSFSLESEPGNKVFFTFPTAGYFPIGWGNMEDRVIIFSTNTQNADSNGEIGILTIDRSAKTGTYVPIYNHRGLNFNAAHQIECQQWPETNSIKRSYWTDWYNTYRGINTANPQFTTYITQPNLVAGKQYMVLTGSVTVAAIDYGPALALYANGTVFTSNGAETYNNLPLVIEYVNVATIDVIPRKNTGNIFFRSWLSGGTLLAGGYRFAYRLLTSDGAVTTWSFLSSQVQLGNTQFPGNGTRTYQAQQGENSNVNSARGISITIKDIDINFSRIQVVACHSTDLLVEENPIMFFDGNISGVSMDFDYMGGENLAVFLFDDLIKGVIGWKRVGTIAPVKNIMFVGRSEIITDPAYDATTMDVETIDYLVPVDQVGRLSNASADFDSAISALGGVTGVQMSSAGGVVSGNILTDQWYKVEGTGSINYTGVGIFAVGATFKGVSTKHKWTVNAGTPSIIAIIRIQKYTGVYDDIKLNDDHAHAKGIAGAYYLKSEMRGEVIRIGMMLYDPFGNPLYVHHIRDEKIPEMYDTLDPNTGNALTYNPRLTEEYANDYGANEPVVATSINRHGLSVRNIGFKFSNINFQEIATNLGCSLAELGNFISGFSIVRAKRDPLTLAQGLMFITSQEIATNLTRPTSHPIASPEDKYFMADGARARTYTYFSPDWIFQKGLVFTPGDKIKCVDYLTDAHAENTFGTLYANNYNFYHKFVSQVTQPPAPSLYAQRGTSNTVDSITVASIGYYGAYGNDGHIFDNSTQSSGTLGTMSGTDRFSRGSTVAVVEVANPTVVWSTFNDVLDGGIPLGMKKPLVNYQSGKSVASLYGGSSAASKEKTVYYHCGHYQAMDAGFIAHIISSVGKTAGMANDVEVFGGDTYVNLFDIGRMVKDTVQVFTPNMFSCSLIFPVESTINIFHRQGRHISLDRNFDPTDLTRNIDGVIYPDAVENFVYNYAYSNQEANISFLARPMNYIGQELFDKRIYASEIKYNGELIDNFRQFLVTNWKDMKATDGFLTNLRSRLDRLYYWQHNSFGYMPVNERSLISDSLGNPVTVGTGGIMQRYDQFDDFFGNQHQFGLGEAEEFFFWVDMKRRGICIASFAGERVDLSFDAGLQSELNDIVGIVYLHDNPILNGGIAVVYNPRFKEAIFVFRGITSGISSKTYPTELIHYYESYPNGFMIRYDVKNKMFINVDDVLPGIMLRCVDDIILSSTQWTYPAITGAQAYQYKDIVSLSGQQYICILAFTTPGTPIPPNTDTTHWKAIYNMSNVFVENNGPIMRFFGWCRDTVLKLIVNPDDSANKTFLNMEFNSSNEFFDNVKFTNRKGTNIDVDIQNSKDYEHRDESWIATIPPSVNGENLVDHYLEIELTKKNEVTGDPTVSKDETVNVVSLITEYYESK